MLASTQKTKNIRVIKRRPERIRGLILTEAVITAIEQHFKFTAVDRCEEAAFIAGYLTASGIGIAINTILPYTENSAGSCEIPLDVTSKIFNFLKNRDQILLAQIHSHPGRGTGHSATDDHWAICDSPGFFSIVIPCYGRFGLGKIFSGGSTICERMPDGQWRQLPYKEIQSRFFVFSESCVII